MQKVMAIVIHEHGAPAAVARVEEVEVPDPRLGEARVRMLAAPINPADLNMIEGTYGTLPPLPAVPGGEGVGVIEQLGAALEDWHPGDHVLLPPGIGTWREAVTLPVSGLVRVPPSVPPLQAAQLRVNPATAWRMLHDFVSLRPGDWLVQNAANSAVGRAVIQIARHCGWRTINLVRRAELRDELLAGGADAVLVEGVSAEELRAAAGGAPLRLALNAVGGESALRLAAALAPGGTQVTYGAMARQPLRIPNGLLIFQDVHFCGFWVTRWFQSASEAERGALYVQLSHLAQRGVLRAKIDRVYLLAAATEALAHAARGGRSGKILFGFDPTLLPPVP